LILAATNALGIETEIPQRGTSEELQWKARRLRNAKIKFQLVNFEAVLMEIMQCVNKFILFYSLYLGAKLTIPMKNCYLLAGLFAITGALAQVHDIERIADSEMKSSSSLMNVTVNPDTQNYDVTYHKLELTVNPAIISGQLSAKVTTTFTALSDMSTIVFDFNDNLTVSSVKKGASTLAFTQSTDELTINLGTTQTAGTSATVEITYSGVPQSDESSYVRSTHSGAPIIWTLSEPFGARDWWPCKQDLNDKADSIDVYITAPAQYTAVANGLQVSATTSGGSKTTYFHHGYPIPAYLVAFAVSNYSVFTLTAGTEPNTFPIVNYVYPENLTTAQSEIQETVAIMDLYETLFETYPFSAEKYGHCQFGGGGGMEHTTVSFMDGFDRQLIAHELGHQWFGDKITCASWKDIWLNEGFASYLAMLVYENFDGLETFIGYKGNVVDFVTSQPGGAVYMTDLEALNSNRIFSSRLSYNKGAMVLEMLRWKLGDAIFFQALKNYLADPALAYKYATTEDLKSHFEAASGLSLTEFFNDWIYNQGYPTYNVTVQGTSGQVTVTVNQAQSHESVAYFEMPVPIRFFGAGGQTFDATLDNTVDGQQFTVNVPFTFTSFAIDPDVHLISRDNTATLGTGQFGLLESVKLYPNPASDAIQVLLPAGVTLNNAVFHNVLGQVVMKSGSQTSWDISKLASGVHFVTLETDSGTRTVKFVKK
jgi:aminopeptidase N